MCSPCDPRPSICYSSPSARSDSDSVRSEHSSAKRQPQQPATNLVDGAMELITAKAIRAPGFELWHAATVIVLCAGNKRAVTPGTNSASWTLHVVHGSGLQNVTSISDPWCRLNVEASWAQSPRGLLWTTGRDPTVLVPTGWPKEDPAHIPC